MTHPLEWFLKRINKTIYYIEDKKEKGILIKDDKHAKSLFNAQHKFDINFKLAKKPTNIKKPKPMKRKKGITPILSYKEICDRAKPVKKEDYLPTKLYSK